MTASHGYEGGWYEEDPEPYECPNLWHVSLAGAPECPLCGATDPLDEDE